MEEGGQNFLIKIRSDANKHIKVCFGDILRDRKFEHFPFSIEISYNECNLLQIAPSRKVVNEMNFHLASSSGIRIDNGGIFRTFLKPLFHY